MGKAHSLKEQKLRYFTPREVRDDFYLKMINSSLVFYFKLMLLINP